MSTPDRFDVSLDLMRRLPPEKVEDNLSRLIELVPDLTEDLLSAIDQPLKVQQCRETGRQYLLCDYNRDESSYRYQFIQSLSLTLTRTLLIPMIMHEYRSPWSNDYEPPLLDGTKPSGKLRKLEVAVNEAFDTYRELYVSQIIRWYS
jgi:capping protein beta